MCRSRIAFTIAVFILASQYLPGQAVFAEETVTGLDGVAAVAANDRYGTFEHSLNLSPEGTYCYRVRLKNLNTKAEERILYVQLPLGFENASAELVPKLVKIKTLPKAEKEGVIKVGKSDQVFQTAAANELPGAKFNYYGDIGGAAVIRLDLTGLKFNGNSHDFDFILQAPNFTEALEAVESFKHGFYLFEKNQGTYNLVTSMNNSAQVHYETLSEAYLSAENAVYSENEEKVADLELQPGDHYSYRVKIKKPLRQDVGSRILLVAMPAFYGNLGSEAYPFLFQEDWLKTDGLAYEELPVLFSETTFNSGPGDASEQSFMALENKEDIYRAAILKIDLSGVQFTGNEASLDFCFKVPDHLLLNSYPEEAQWKDMALHGYALYEFGKDASLIYKKSLGASLLKAHINQNPLIMAEAPYLMEAEDGLSLRDEESISVYGRTIEVVEGNKYEYQISLVRPYNYAQGYKSFLYVSLPDRSTVLQSDIIAEGLDIRSGVFYSSDHVNTLKDENVWRANIDGEIRSIKIDLDGSRFTGERAVVTIPLLAPEKSEVSYAVHNFVLSAIGKSGEGYIFTNEKNDLAMATFLAADKEMNAVEEETKQLTNSGPVQSEVGALYGGVKYGIDFSGFTAIEQEKAELQDIESTEQYLAEGPGSLGSPRSPENTGSLENTEIYLEEEEISDNSGVATRLETKRIEGNRSAPEQSPASIEETLEEAGDREDKDNPVTMDNKMALAVFCLFAVVIFIFVGAAFCRP